MVIVFIWLLLRFLTSIIVALASALKPLTVLEKAVPLFPLANPLGVWLERVWLSPWSRWDAVWYQQIVEQGYSAVDGTAQFHPLYSWLTSLITATGAHPLFGLLVISSVSGLGFLFIYDRLSRLDLSPADARYSLVWMLLAPAAFILFAPYSEALFMLLAAGCIYLCRRQRWWLAGLAGGLAVLTRQQGLFLLLPMAWELWEDADRSWAQVRVTWKNWLSLFTIPVFYAFWLGYRWLVLRDVSVEFDSFNNLIYSFLISPSADQVVPYQTFLWPWHALSLAMQKLIKSPDLDLWVNIIAGMIFLCWFTLGWKNMRLSYRLYGLAIILISFSYYTGPYHPYMGLPRHLLLGFPVFIAVAPRLNRPFWGALFISIASLGYLFLLLIYSLESWVP